MKLSFVLPASLSLLMVTTPLPGDDSTGPQDGGLQTALALVSTERMMADIAELSSATFGGRQTGTDQDRASATFVVNRFRALHMQRALPPFAEHATPPQQEWQQTTPVTVRSIPHHAVLRLSMTPDQAPLQVGSDFLPVLDSPSADVRARIVFVGYGLADTTQGIDDYAGVDVQNKVVLFLRGKPDKFTGSAGHADKERLAKEHGALAYLTATGPVLSAYEMRRGVTGTPNAFYSGTAVMHQLPGAWISTATAEAILREGGGNEARLKSLQEELNRTGHRPPVATHITAELKWDSHSSTGELLNVGSIIPGASPRGEETVIIGAHRDHFGKQAGLLFPGADDNASGTAVILEVARVLAEAAAAPKRSILFVSFSGEEQGLLGSRLYVAQPIVPLQKTVAMINVDHAGIGNGRLTVGLTGLDKAVAREAGEAAGLPDHLDIYGFFPGGDHVPFKEAGVPTATIVSSGVHPHYHQPTDTGDTIHPEILGSAARYVLALAWRLANAP